MPSIHFKNIGPLIINLDSTELSDNERQLIKHELVGGIILFSHNFISKKQLCSLINDIKSIKDNLLITIDHEGGRVQRLLNGFVHLPSFEKISEIENEDIRKKIAYQAGYISAYELSEVGIDINYSPVIDINHNKKNNLLRGRTFGDNSENIISLANEYIQGSLDGGVLPVLKHFPGHGRVMTDSHIEDCLSDIDINQLLNTDILPFKVLHDKYTEVNLPIMTSHIIYSKIDKYITTYSKEWLGKQSNLIFTKKPFFISDDLEMFSATTINNKNISCEERVLLALKAGCRMIIATTMQDNDIINRKSSHEYYRKNYFTNNIIEHYQKNHDKMLEIVIPKRLDRNKDKYEKYLKNIKLMEP
jgi:beta-N-acetylhexosaminidase